MYSNGNKICISFNSFLNIIFSISQMIVLSKPSYHMSSLTLTSLTAEFVFCLCLYLFLLFFFVFVCVLFVFVLFFILFCWMLRYDLPLRQEKSPQAALRKSSTVMKTYSPEVIPRESAISMNSRKSPPELRKNTTATNKSFQRSRKKQ